jgi:hypothetical protein
MSTTTLGYFRAAFTFVWTTRGREAASGAQNILTAPGWASR